MGSRGRRPEKPTPESAQDSTQANSRTTIEQKASRELEMRSRVSTIKKQKAISQVLDQPELLDALQQLAKLKPTNNHSRPQGFHPATPPTIQVSAKERLNPKASTAVYRPKKEIETKDRQKKLYQRILNRLPHWMSLLTSSEDRHKFALKCFSSVYERGVWFESLEGGPWTCIDSFGVEAFSVEVTQNLCRSSFAIEAMETLKVVSAPRGWSSSVFGKSYPIHFIVIERPRFEKRSFFCFSGIQEYDDIQQFVIRSALYEFQKDY